VEQAVVDSGDFFYKERFMPHTHADSNTAKTQYTVNMPVR